jgi:predicted metal-dependent hydrolase/protein-S-isoprenylcysteine O-methyltransferase Ste14
MDLNRALRRLYGLGCYAAGGLATPYLLLFAGDAGVPITVNRGLGDQIGIPHPSTAVALVIDVALIAAFGLQHSVMALPAWKRWLGRRLPPPIERSTYVLAASLVLAGAMLAWQPIDGTVWRLDGAWAHAMTAGYIAGFALVYLAALWLDHFHLLGLRQAWFDAPVSAPAELRITGPYRFVRHPLMTGLLMAFWYTPHMTWGQLVFAAGMTGYVVVGTLHEERALIRQFGDAYRAYARLTPMLIPSLVPVVTRYRARRTPAPAITVRRPDIEYSSYGPGVWYADNVVATAMLTAYSALFPSLERFMADELRTTLPDLRDPELARAVREFAGQEAMHAHEHARSLAALAGLGYRVASLERGFAAVTRWLLRPLVRFVGRPICATAGSIAVFAGVEHWTAVLAEAVLRQPYPRLYSPMVALYYWHAAEEIEHRSVVADVLAHLGRSYLVRVTMFAFGTLAFGALSIAGTLAILLQIPAIQGRGVVGWIGYPLRVVWDGLAFFVVREKIGWHILWGALRYLAPFHHPDGPARRAAADLTRLALERAAVAGAVPRALSRIDLRSPIAGASAPRGIDQRSPI